ncbi:hypothetical protein BV20DRAFT_1052471 [Pilatotrama ljubarskyi]|nr:hypothetical protein BV20DRAFT_1052471 [Pilatotrama ljubarskyi]
MKCTNIFSAPITKALQSEHAPETSGGQSVVPSVKVEDDDEGGWTPVLRKKTSRERLLAKDGPPHLPSGTSNSKPTKSSLKNTESTVLGDKHESTELRAFAKGKSVDPRNWGTLDVDPRELDPRAQLRELAKYAAPLQRVTDPSKWHMRDTTPAVDDSDEELWRNNATNAQGTGNLPRVSQPVAHDAAAPVPHIGNPANAIVSSSISAARAKGTTPGVSGVDAAKNLRPVTQVEPSSYLGQAFRDLADKEPSEPSSSDSSSSSDEGAGGGERSDAARRKKHKYHEKLREKMRELAHLQKANTSKAPVLKPREPTPYGGVADVRTFHKFVQDITAYLDGYQLEPCDTL